MIGGGRTGEEDWGVRALDVVEETGRSSTVDADLARAAQAGSRQAFDRLVVRHADDVVRTAYVIVGDPDDANDVAQDAFISAYRGLDGYQPTARSEPGCTASPSIVVTTTCAAANGRAR